MCYVFTHGYCSITNSGFPHSEIPGSQLTYSSPRHIGVSAVLLRLLVPRHPPCALINLTTDGQLKKVDREAITLLDACFMFQCRSIQFSKNKYWWSLAGSNRCPPACKAGALPAELRPLRGNMVGLSGLEPPTSRLSGVRSNQLSYRPS